MLNRILYRVLPLAAAVSLHLGFISSAYAAEPYRVGVIAPTSGPAATVGLRQLKTLQWWAQSVQKTGGIKGHPVELIHCNDEGKPEKAVTCARDLLGQEVTLLINSSVTGPVKASLPLVKNGPVMITASPYIEPDPASFVFQTTPTDRDMTEALARYLKQNGITSLGMVAATDASGEGSVANANAVFPAAGITVDVTRIDLKANDASIQLARLARPDIPVVYSAYSGAGAATVVKSFTSLDLQQLLIVSNANVSDAFVKLIKGVAPKRLLSVAIRGVDPDLLTSEAERRRMDDFVTSYKEWAGEQPDHLNLLALGLADTVAAILTNVEAVDDPVAVKRFLETTPIASFQPIRFTPDRHIGMTPDDAAVLELKEQGWKKASAIGTSAN